MMNLQLTFGKTGLTLVIVSLLDSFGLAVPFGTSNVGLVIHAVRRPVKQNAAVFPLPTLAEGVWSAKENSGGL